MGSPPYARRCLNTTTLPNHVGHLPRHVPISAMLAGRDGGFEMSLVGTQRLRPVRCFLRPSIGLPSISIENGNPVASLRS